ncbi:MAG: hypothetical protein ACRCZO_01580, partial [Cetobacterium sp.]
DPIEGYVETMENELKYLFKNVMYISGCFPKKEERSKRFKILRELKRIYIFREIFEKKRREHIEKILENVVEFDYFISIGTGEFSPFFIKRLKEKNPRIKTILFLWDKVEYLPKGFNLEGFDQIFSFDKDDCEKYDYTFRESFYVNTSKNIVEKNIDLYYLGALREIKRYNKLLKLKEYLEKNLLSYNIKLFIDKIIEKNNKLEFDKDLITRDRINYLLNIEFVKKAKVLLEINYKNQKGLTLRAMESILGKTKLITDNSDIINYDFYKKENIYIVKDIEEIKNIPLEFFKTSYVDLDEKIVERYSCKGFLKDILGERKE